MTIVLDNKLRRNIYIDPDLYVTKNEWSWFLLTSDVTSFLFYKFLLNAWFSRTMVVDEKMECLNQSNSPKTKSKLKFVRYHYLWLIVFIWIWLNIDAYCIIFYQVRIALSEMWGIFKYIISFSFTLLVINVIFLIPGHSNISENHSKYCRLKFEKWVQSFKQFSSYLS